MNFIKSSISLSLTAVVLTLPIAHSQPKSVGEIWLNDQSPHPIQSVQVGMGPGILEIKYGNFKASEIIELQLPNHYAGVYLMSVMQRNIGSVKLIARRVERSRITKLILPRVHYDYLLFQAGHDIPEPTPVLTLFQAQPPILDDLTKWRIKCRSLLKFGGSKDVSTSPAH